MKLRRSNLSYKCAEKYCPRHQCKEKIVMEVEKCEEEEGEGTENQSLAEGKQDDAEDPTTLSLQAIAGGSSVA